MLHPQSPTTQPPSAQASATGSLEAAHDAAWSRFNAAEAEVKAKPGNRPAMVEYCEAAKQLQHVRNQYFVNSLGGMS
jgi:hypothetical protein